MTKIYRTAQGKRIDIDAFIARNENTQAVGNMNVNARGDVLGAGGRVVKTREQVMAEYYRDNPNAVRDEQVTRVSLQPDAPIVQEAVADMPKEAAEFEEDDQAISEIKKAYQSNNKGKK